MEDSQRFAIELEWSEYARSAYFATVVPGAQVLISSEAILITDPQVPMVEANHAALLRTTPERADALIERITHHYQEHGLQATIVISPNCTPDDLAERLQVHGFRQSGELEHWLTITESWYAEALRCPSNITLREIGVEGLPDFCRVMAAAYDMPDESVPILVHSLSFISGLPGIHNYVAYIENEPVGCMSLYSYAGYSALGSGGVLPGLRNTGAAFALAGRGYQYFKQDGSKYMTFQTVLPRLARLFRIAGCKEIFTRAYYTLE
jgi:hypothetical protein